MIIVYINIMNENLLTSAVPVGWREWVALPEWNVPYTKAKIDTGARTSSLHVEEIKKVQKGDKTILSFMIFPWQKNAGDPVHAEAELVEYRTVKSSTGHEEKRPVVKTAVSINGKTVIAEMTLTNRDVMGFRMLIGREALRESFAVLPGQSYLGGKPSKDVRISNRSTDDESQ